MSRRRRAPLSPEDRALWRAATRDAVPLPPDLRGAPAPPDSQGEFEPGPKPAARSDQRPGAGDRPPPGRGQPAAPAWRAAPAPPGPRVSLDLAPPAATRLGAGAAGLDRRTAERLRRGARRPQARVDLHGMDAARAHRALERCIAEALERGLRLVLVITGKGARPGAEAPFMPRPEGRLRREAPRWLQSGPHAREIVGIYEAHPRHGGPGAFYVYLKRRR